MKNKKENSYFIPSGVQGFDNLIGGGFEKHSVTLLRGSTGTGKTIFSLEFLYNGYMKYKEPGIFITFEETKESALEIQ